MNGKIFETWVETKLAPTLSPGDVVILDNVAFHKSREPRNWSRLRRLASLHAALFDQVLKVPDAPIAPGPQFVELQTDTPDARPFEDIRHVRFGYDLWWLLFERRLARFFIHAQRGKNLPLRLVGNWYFRLVGGRPCQG